MIVEDPVPSYLSPAEVEARLRDIQDEKMRLEGPTPDLDEFAVISALQDLETETRLLQQIRNLQQNMLMIEGILLEDEVKGKPPRLSLRSIDGPSGEKSDGGRAIELQVGHMTLHLAIGDWCTLIAGKSPDTGVPVEVRLDPILETDDEPQPPKAAA